MPRQCFFKFPQRRSTVSSHRMDPSGYESIAERFAREALNDVGKYRIAAENAYRALRRTQVQQMTDRIRRTFLVIEYYEKGQLFEEALAKINEFLDLKSFSDSTKVLLREKQDRIKHLSQGGQSK